MVKSDFNPQGVEIRFDENKHRYVTDNVDDFTSVTTLIHNFFPKFDVETHSARKAIQLGITQEEVKSMWAEEGRIANEYGHNVHTYCEQKLLGLELPKPINAKEKLAFKQADEVIKMFNATGFKFEANEKIIFSEKYKIAGMIDLVMKFDDNIYLIDWKTNKQIKTECKWGNKGLRCLADMDNVNFNHYSLQLNLYRWILLKEGYYTGNIGMMLVHIRPDKYKIYPVDNMESTIEEMIKWEQTA